MGTGVTAGANDSDGSAVSGISALTHDCEYLVVGISNWTANGENSSTLLDILIDPAGGTSWSTDPLISDLLTGQADAGTTNSDALPIVYHFPIWIKSGTSIGLRAQTARATDVSGRVWLYAYGGNANPSSWWCGQHVTTIGVDTATSQGTNHTPGNSGAYSTWADLGSPLPATCGALQFAVQGTNTDTTQAGLQYFFEFGVGSTRIGPNIWRSTTTGENGTTISGGVLFSAQPSGTQLQVRATCSGTAEILDVAAYAVH
jgi:hypothetical protein